MVFGPTKTPEIQQALAGTRKRHTHAVEKINNRGRHFAHGFGWRLVRQEIAAVNRVVEMFPGGIASTFGIDRAVDAALRAHRVGALHWHNRKEIDGMPCRSD